MSSQNVVHLTGQKIVEKFAMICPLLRRNTADKKQTIVCRIDVRHGIDVRHRAMAGGGDFSLPGSLSGFLVKRQTAERLRRAQAGLDAAADALEEHRLDMELRAATQEADWHEGPDGRACRQELTGLRDKVELIRGIDLSRAAGLG